MKRNEVDINKVSPMMKQYMEMKDKYPDIIIFFRIGDFYEMFFEDALTASHELELTLTGKSAGLEERIPMCGIPFHAANIYIDKLIAKGYKVGICEQMEDPRYTNKLVKRDLIQVISKGTIMDNESLKENENNYIGYLADFDHAYALCFADITTGEIKVKLIDHDVTNVISEIVSLGLKELVINNKINKAIADTLDRQFHLAISINNDLNDDEKYAYIYADLDDFRYIISIKGLLTYIEETQKRQLVHLQKAIVINNKTYLKMDIHTKRNLELTETVRNHERNYSLIWLLDKTKTAMGSRMLHNFIENPLVDKDIINKRYDLIDTLLKEFIIKDDIAKLLYEVYDLERLAGRVAFENANARDLLQLEHSLHILPTLKTKLEQINYYDTLDTLEELDTLLAKSIYDEPPVSLKEGYLIKEGYNHDLDELKALRKGGKDFVAQFELEERAKTGIKSLHVGYNHVFGYYIEVSKGQINLIKDEYGYIRKQTLSNSERYISPILKEKEDLILNAEERIVDLEYNLFVQIRDEVKKYIPALQRIAKVVSEVDVMVSLATVASLNNYVRPTLTDKHLIDIKANRHPVIEKVLATSFVPNDIYMDEKTDILLITGPNMAGKSTYMRELAITVIMAQIGSFVPASQATLPIFDSIFTRIGASDDLVGGESTFMVEMEEANYAISKATDHSLILFDELGRGTATFDGMALAQAIIEYISQHVKAKTLFSTHYHELTDLDQKLTNLKNVHVSALEENGNLTFLHKVKDGSIDKSYGIHVAQLAHLPDVVIKRANDILRVYESNEQHRDLLVQEALPLDLVTSKSKVEEALAKVDPLAITPIEALNIIDHLKKISEEDL